MVRRQYCHNCGKYLGEYDSWPGDIESCGDRECEREARIQQAERDADARERAESDGYDRYR